MSQQTPSGRQKTAITAALICGIAALVLSPTVLLGICAGLAAVLLGAMQWAHIRDKKLRAGFICGIVGIAVSLLLFATGFSLIGKLVFVPKTDATAPNSKDISAVHESVTKRVPITVIDNEPCKYEITSLEYDEGDVIVRVSVKNNSRNASSSVSTYEHLLAPNKIPWYVNGVECEPVSVDCRVENGETKTSWFFFSHDDLKGISSLDDIYSIHGAVRIENMVNYSVASTYDFAIDL